MDYRALFARVSSATLFVTCAAGCSEAVISDDALVVDRVAEALSPSDCTPRPGADTVGICHATGSSSQPYVHLKVSGSGCKNGHVKHANDFASNDPTCSRCVATSCASAGATCGMVPDGCGGTLDCGTCNAPQTCGGAGIPNECGGGCPAGTKWMPALGGCGGSVTVSGAQESYAQKIFTAGSSPVVINAVSSWESLTVDPARTTSSAPTLVVAPYQGGVGCDFIYNYSNNTFLLLALDTQDPASRDSGMLTAPPGGDVYVAGSDCYLPDNVLGSYRIDWKLVP